MATNGPLFGQAIDDSSSAAISPQQLQMARLLAMQMQGEGMDASPIRSPWQGVGRAVQSMVGGYGQYQADQQERVARQQAAQQLAGALQGNDVAGAVTAMSNPFTNPEAAKLAASIMTPQMVDTGMGVQARDRFGNPVGPFIPKIHNMPEEYGRGNKFNNFYQGTPEGGVAPVQPGTVGTQPAAPVTSGSPQGSSLPNGEQIMTSPVSPQTQQKIDFANENTAKVTGMTEEAKEDQKKLSTFRDEGVDSAQKLDQLGQFRQLAQRAGYGASAELKTWLGQHGIDTAGYTENQLYKSAISFMAPQLRPEGSGRIMGQEYSGFKDALGSLMTTPQGRQIALDYLGRTHQWSVAAGNIANDRGLAPGQAFGQIMSLKLPQIDMSGLDRANAGPQTDQNSGVTTLPSGITIRQIK